MNYPKSFTDLVECFKRLPGIGGKSAERLAYHVLSMDKEYVQEFANVLAHFQDNIHYCKKCGHICEGELCEICKDETRDQRCFCYGKGKRISWIISCFTWDDFYD